MQPHYRGGDGERSRLQCSVRKRESGLEGSERGRDGSHHEEEEVEGGRRLEARWWTWLRSLPAEALDLLHCGRLQDFRPNYRCSWVENASLHSCSSVWLFIWFSSLHCSAILHVDGSFWSLCVVSPTSNRTRFLPRKVSKAPFVNPSLLLSSTDQTLPLI